MGELTDEAKALIADSIRIVREDRMDRYVRDRVAKHTEPKEPPKPADPPPTPPVDPPKPPETPPPTPPVVPAPPPNPPPTDPPKDPPKKNVSRWWGELDD